MKLEDCNTAQLLNQVKVLRQAGLTYHLDRLNVILTDRFDKWIRARG